LISFSHPNEVMIVPIAFGLFCEKLQSHLRNAAVKMQSAAARLTTLGNSTDSQSFPQCALTEIHFKSSWLTDVACCRPAARQSGSSAHAVPERERLPAAACLLPQLPSVCKGCGLCSKLCGCDVVQIEDFLSPERPRA
jgi:hypothetical protein